MLALVSAVAAVQAQSPAELPQTVALADLREVLHQLELLRAASLERLADLDRRELFTLDGAASASAWVQAQPVSAGRGEVALARRLGRLPHVQAAVTAGRIDLVAAGMVGVALEKAARHLDRPDGRIGAHDAEEVVTNAVVRGVLQLCCEGVGGLADDDPALRLLVDELVEIATQRVPQRERLEQAMVVLARRLPRSMLAAGLDRLLDAVTPEELEHRVETAHERRGLTLVRNGDGSGYTVTRGHLSLELGELLQVVLDAARATDPANPQDTEARRRAHEEAPDGDLTATDLTLAPRTKAQRDHDALLLALRATLDTAALGTRGKVAPHLVVTVGLDAAHDEPGALPAVTASGARLPASLVRKLLCDSALTRVVLSLGRRVLEVSHSERTAKPHERLALAVEWGNRCAGRGCSCPPGTPLVPHHVEPHAKTGITARKDTVPICQLTHDDIHVRGRTVTLRDGRKIGPDGWVDARPVQWLPDDGQPGAVAS